MKKTSIIRKLAVVLAVILVISLFSAAPLSVSANDWRSEDAVKQAVGAFFSAKYEMLSTLSFSRRDFSSFYADAADTDLELRSASLETLIEHRKLQPLAFTFSDYELFLEYWSIAIDGNVAQVELTEGSDIKFDGYNAVSGSRGVEHSIKMTAENGRWLIVSDNYYDDVADYLNAYVCQGMSYAEAEAIILDKTKEQVCAKSRVVRSAADMARIEAQNEAFVEEARFEMNRSSRVYGAYSAISYARQWAYGRNPSYADCSPNDCVNFVSQSVRAGGVIDDNVGSYVWYYNSYGFTSSWISSTSFESYLLNNGGNLSNIGVYAVSSSFGSAQTGDIVFHENGTNIGDGVDHTMIITSYVYNALGSISDYLICEHSGSSGNKDYPLSNKPYYAQYFVDIVCYFD